MWVLVGVPMTTASTTGRSSASWGRGSTWRRAWRASAVAAASIGSHDPGELGVGVLADGAGVDLADAAGPQHRDAEHVRCLQDARLGGAALHGERVPPEVDR